jgi:signal transduction histidine kinase
MNVNVFDRRAVIASLIALAVMILAFLGAFIWLQYQMMLTHDQSLYNSLKRELQLRQQFDERLGRNELIRGLSFRNRFIENDRYIMLWSAEGSILVGDTDLMPGGRAIFEAKTDQVRVPLADGSHAFLVRQRLPDGAVLAMSYRDVDRRAIAQSLGRVAISLMIALLLVGLATVLALNRYVLDHVRDLAGTARRIMRGQMTARAPGRQRLDAMGELTMTFNEMLDQNEALIIGMRTVTESLAHDLRTPLMRVQREISAARQSGDSKGLESHLSTAEQESQRALQTFNSLVDLARAEAGFSRDAMENIDLAELIRDLVELFGPLAEERGQYLSVNTSPIMVMGHRQILAQALGNLLENAIKYSPAGSTLQVIARVHPQDGVPELVVQDSGPGIPARAREQVLRPFVRLSNAGEPGSGMGLAIAAAVARLHRGKLLLEDASPGLRVRLQFGLG